MMLCNRCGCTHTHTHSNVLNAIENIVLFCIPIKKETK